MRRSIAKVATRWLKAIIHINNATDGAGDLRGLSGLLSSLTYDELALMQDLVANDGEIIFGDANGYTLRGHAVSEDVVSELIGAGYLEARPDESGTIWVYPSPLFEAKRKLYSA